MSDLPGAQKSERDDFCEELHDVDVQFSAEASIMWKVAEANEFDADTDADADADVREEKLGIFDGFIYSTSPPHEVPRLQREDPACWISRISSRILRH